MVLLLISLPWWGLLLLCAGCLAVGAFFAWNNSKASLKDKGKQEVNDIANKVTSKN